MKPIKRTKHFELGTDSKKGATLPGPPKWPKAWTLLTAYSLYFRILGYCFGLFGRSRWTPRVHMSHYSLGKGSQGSPINPNSP